MKKKSRQTVKKHRKNIQILLLLSVLILTIIGISFALFSMKLIGTKTNIITTARFDFALENETPESGIVLENEYPKLDEEGLMTVAYEFDLVSYSTIAADYVFYLQVPFSSDLQPENIKYHLKRNEKNVSMDVPLLSSTLTKETILTKTDDIAMLGTNGSVGNKKKISYGTIVRDTVIYNYNIDDNTISETEDILLENRHIYYDKTIVIDGVEYVIALGKGEYDVDASNMYYIKAEDVYFNYITECIYNKMENQYFLLYKLDSAVLNALTTNHYKLNLWVDYDAGNEAIDKSFEAKALVQVSQSLPQ